MNGELLIERFVGIEGESDDETFDCRKKWRNVDLIKLLDMIERIRHNSSTLFDFSVVQWPRFHSTKTKCVRDSLLFTIAAPSPSSIDEMEDRQRTTPLLD